MKLSIVVLTPGPSQGKVIPISGVQFVIGRDPDCQLRPASIHISKRHCALVRRDERVFVKDFGSTNGTFVNDRQIRGEIELLDGDKLRVGPLAFSVRVESAPINRPTPPPPTKATTQMTSPPAAKTPAAEEPDQQPGGDDEAAAMLLAMQDNDAPTGTPNTEVPEGSTVFDLPAPTAEDKDKDKEKPKQPSGDTSTAAKSILEKYLKRPRPS